MSAGTVERSDTTGLIAPSLPKRAHIKKGKAKEKENAGPVVKQVMCQLTAPRNEKEKAKEWNVGTVEDRTQ